MGATYTRQSSAGITDGAVIEASDINDEFDQLLAAFVAASGHTHDGTAAEGGPVAKLLGTSLTLGDGTAGTDITVTFDGETGDGVLTWMEDEDYFKFSDDILINSTEKLMFQDTGTYVYSNADGDLDIVSDGTAVDSINLESAGGITLDAGTAGSGIIYEDDGTAMLSIINSSSDVILTTKVQDKDFIIKGDDGGSAITALTLDMSEAGAATFNNKVVATELDISGNMDIDGTSNLDIVDIDGAVQVDSTITVGVNDTGYDVKFFGATSGAYMLWDESTDDLVLAGASKLYLYDAAGGEYLSSSGSALTISSGGTPWELPAADGSANQVLKTDGSGNLDWTSITSATITAVNNATANRLTTIGSTTTELDGEANLTFTGSALTCIGTVTVGVDDTGHDVKFFGATAGSYALWDESADSLLLTDSTPLKIGDAQDLTLYHDGSNSYITNAVGALKVATETSGIAVTIGHTTSETTVADNLTVTGDFAAGNFKFGGTDFTNSLLIGHSTTGTLSAAQQNVGVGITALDALTSGDQNTAVGYGAGSAINSGLNDVCIGHSAGMLISSGQANIAIGYRSLDAVTTTHYNTAVGHQSLSACTGDGNVGVGTDAGLLIAGGDNNICLGYHAGNNITSGSGNVVIGVADVSSATGDDQLSISDGEDGSVVWMTGNSSGAVTIPGDLTVSGTLTGAASAGFALAMAVAL